MCQTDVYQLDRPLQRRGPYRPSRHQRGSLGKLRTLITPRHLGRKKLRAARDCKARRAIHLCRRREPPDSDLIVSKPSGRHMDSQIWQHLKRVLWIGIKRCLLIILSNKLRTTTRLSLAMCRPPGFAVRKIGYRRLTPPAGMCRPPGFFVYDTRRSLSMAVTHCKPVTYLAPVTQTGTTSHVD
jgi:hypothetical protein